MTEEFTNVETAKQTGRLPSAECSRSYLTDARRRRTARPHGVGLGVEILLVAGLLVIRGRVRLATVEQEMEMCAEPLGERQPVIARPIARRVSSMGRTIRRSCSTGTVPATCQCRLRVVL